MPRHRNAVQAATKRADTIGLLGLSNGRMGGIQWLQISLDIVIIKLVEPIPKTTAVLR